MEVLKIVNKLLSKFVKSEQICAYNCVIDNPSFDKRSWIRVFCGSINLRLALMNWLIPILANIANSTPILLTKCYVTKKIRWHSIKFNLDHES
jgi:hypothetical protein